MILGIDPGKGGAVVGLDQRFIEHRRGIDNRLDLVFAIGEPVVAVVADTATWLIRTGKGAKTEYNEDAISTWLKAQSIDLAILETQQAMPAHLRGRTQGVSSSFSIGVGYGLWRGLLAGLGISRHIVHPATWTRAILKGAPGEGKARAISVVHRRLPGLDLGPKSKAQARADAACLALYGLGLGIPGPRP